jgi:hypothetical protein
VSGLWLKASRCGAGLLLVVLGALSGGGCRATDSTASGCAQLAGSYEATLSGTLLQQPSTTAVDLVQRGCTVTAAIDSYGQLSCTAAPIGISPRLTACTETLNACTLQKDYTFDPQDDGTALTFDVITRQTMCTGTDGGTLLFRLVLTPQH